MVTGDRTMLMLNWNSPEMIMSRAYWRPYNVNA